jgi:hypothetical protein
MQSFFETLNPWGPVFFGVLLAAPMAAAVMDQAGVSLGIANIIPAMVVGGLWGLLTKQRGRWL